jgi:hypothetical protein
MTDMLAPIGCLYAFIQRHLQVRDAASKALGFSTLPKAYSGQQGHGERFAIDRY